MRIGEPVEWPEEILCRQRQICRAAGAVWMGSSLDSNAGIAANLSSGLWPLNGLRHLPAGGTCGWYLWAGESFSDRPDFFSPACVRHLLTGVSPTVDYLGLPPGWRFLLAPGYEDVWFDPTILHE